MECALYSMYLFNDWQQIKSEGVFENGRQLEQLPHRGRDKLADIFQTKLSGMKMFEFRAQLDWGS